MDDSTQRSSEKESEKKDMNLAETSMNGEDSESLKNLYEDGVLDPIYHAKTLVLNRALQEQGMGRYQVTRHFTLPVSKVTMISSTCYSWSQALGGLREFQLGGIMIIDVTVNRIHSDSVWPVSRTNSPARTLFLI